MELRAYFQLANLLTFSRLLLTVPFILCFHRKMIPQAGIIFGIAALTDFFDGKVARKQGVTSFGSFMDSLVDKILIGAALICLYLYKPESLDNDISLIPIWMVIVILGREVLVTALRILFVAKHGEVISANRWGKYKTTSQVIVIFISLLLLMFQGYLPFVIQQYGPVYIMMYVPLGLTVASGLEFIYGNRKAFTTLHQN